MAKRSMTRAHSNWQWTAKGIQVFWVLMPLRQKFSYRGRVWIQSSSSHRSWIQVDEASRESPGVETQVIEEIEKILDDVVHGDFAPRFTRSGSNWSACRGPNSWFWHLVSFLELDHRPLMTKCFE